MHAIAILALAGLPAAPAPAPFPRPAQARELTAAQVTGRWRVSWGSVTCHMTFAADGSYRCDWPPAVVYTGAWGVKAGVLYIAESTDLSGMTPWTIYAFRLDPRTLRGTQADRPNGIELTLIRKEGP